MKKKFLAVFLCFILMAAALVGCGNKASEETASQQDQTSGDAEAKSKDIVIGVAATFISMDPHDTNDTLSYSVQKSMMQGLVGFDKDMNVIPVLAESYESNKEATEFTFKLHEGIKFHDGTDFNAEAVKVNVDRLANPENKLKRHSLFEVVDRTEVVDAYTVKVVLKESFGAMINTFAHPAAMIHSPAALEKYGKEVSRNPVGTGPFVFNEWVPGDHLTVVKNENYWKNGMPKVDSVTFKPVPENGTRVAMLQTGEADFIYQVPPEQAKIIEGQEGIVLENTPSIIVRYLAMNCMKKPFDDIRVRKAINYALDKKAYEKIVYQGFADDMKSIIAPNVQFYEEQTPYTYDVEKAKALLKEAGYENGFETTIWGNNNSDTVKSMEFIQQQLSKINIKVNVEPMESGTRAEKIWSVQNPEDAGLEMYYAGWSPSTGDADWGIRPLFASNAFPPKSFNTAYYASEEADQYISAAIKTADPQKRNEAYKKVQEIIWNDAPWAFLGVNQNMAGKKASLEGVYLLPDGSLSVEEAEIK
ncbi:MAG: glutathione ABC transporter substrate-binding protein [Marinisporobacter sp.]|jgi:glutathione transport system substrate-binding protein|nr:glutathione ABC transporter substrate-binding protein [Marinisporobacter sp.]